MKKLLIAILSIICFIPLVANAQTGSTSLSGPSSIDAGSEFTLSLYVKGSNMWGIEGTLKYDTNKLTLVSSSGSSGFTATVGSKIVLDSANAVNGNVVGVTLKFKAKSSFKSGEKTTISVSNLTGATDSDTFTLSGCSKTITVNVPKSTNNNLSDLSVDGTKVSGFSKSKTSYSLSSTDKDSITITAKAEDSKAKVSGTGKKSLKYGSNKFTITVKAENGSTKKYTISITRKDNRSSNNNLSNLTVSEGKIKFNKNTTSYTITVDNKITKININATAEDSKSTVTGTGSKSLKVYQNTFKVIVTAENGSKKTYKVNVLRKDKDGNAGALSSNNKLSSLEVEGYNINFKSSKQDYSLTVDNDVNNLNIKAKASDSNSDISIDNPEELKVGNNTITITVTAQNGEEKKYTINVTRKDDSPTTTIKDLPNIVDKVTSNSIVVDIKDDINDIPSSTIDLIKGKDLNVTINKYDNDKLLYAWIINGKEITKSFDFNTYVQFSIDNIENLEKTINYSEIKVLNYLYSGDLPNNTKFKVYVGDQYNNGDKLNLYYYDPNNGQVSLEKKDLVVTDSYVEFDIDHCSNYFLTKATFNEEKKANNISIWVWIELIVIIGILVIDFLNINPINKLKDLISSKLAKSKK